MATQKDLPFNAGHRQRLQQKFLEKGADAFADYELLELILMKAIPRCDVKPLAKELLHQFGSLKNVLCASPEELKTVKGIKDSAVTIFQIIVQVAQRMSFQNIEQQPILACWEQLHDYAVMQYVNETVEKLYVLYLDARLRLVKAEAIQSGTDLHVAIYPREILKRALLLNAHAVILMHNHPSGDAHPSQDDIKATREVKTALYAANIRLEEHLIIGKNKQVYSFRAAGIL
ncbi:MAG: DNA repair protein RadC [Alphaproteobacteria bacterium]|nr:DNA repair protein RadC [Alphaproteobacteria bacterium]